MRTTKRNLIVAVFLLQAIVLVAELVAPYSLLFKAIFVIAVIGGFSHLFGENRHWVLAALWSVLSVFSRVWPVGILTVVCYWILFSQRRDLGHPTRRAPAPTVSGLGDYTLASLDAEGDLPDGILYEMPVWIPILGIRVPSFIKVRYIQKKRTMYQYVVRFLGVFQYPTEVTRCAEPDLCDFWHFTELLGWTRMEMWADDQKRYIHFWAPRRQALGIQADISHLITKACKANDLKRVVPPGASARKHPEKT